MIYHLAYDGTLTYTDDLGVLTHLSEIPEEADLTRLTWTLSDLTVDAEYQQLALRNARPGPHGIYFPAENISARIQLDDLSRSHATMMKSRPQRLDSAARIGDAVGDSQWAAQSMEDERSVDRSVETSKKKLRQQIDAILAEPITQEVRRACLVHGIVLN